MSSKLNKSKQSPLRKEDDEDEEFNENQTGDSSGKVVKATTPAKKKNKKQDSAPVERIVSSSVPIAKAKRAWESDEEVENGDLNQEDEVEEEKVVKKKHKKSISVLQTANVVQLTSLLSSDIKLFRKYIQSVNLTDELAERNKLIDETLKRSN